MRDTTATTEFIMFHEHDMQPARVETEGCVRKVIRGCSKCPKTKVVEVTTHDWDKWTNTGLHLTKARGSAMELAGKFAYSRRCKACGAAETKWM